MILDLHSVANVLSGIKYTHSADHLLTGLIEECYTHPGIYTWYRPSPHRSDRRLLHSPWDIHMVQTISSQVWQKTVTLTLRYTHGADHLPTGLTEECYTHPGIQTISLQVWQKTVTLTLRYTHSADHLLAGQIVDCYTHPEIYTRQRLSYRPDRWMLHSP